MSMFGRMAQVGDDEDKKDVFAPVADLMVGVVFIFMLLMLALVLNLQREDTVPKSDYDQRVAEVHALKAEVAQLKERLKWESDLRASAEARAENLAKANARLVDFVRFIRDANVMHLMSQLANADKARSRLLEEIREKLTEAAKIDVRVNPAAGTLQLPAGSLFAVGHAAPSEDGKKIIIQLGAVLANVLPCYSVDVRGDDQRCRNQNEASRLNAVYIEGHTDISTFSAPGARFTDNWDLSAGRAIEAYKLVSAQYETLTVLRNKDGDPLLGVSGYAETRPADRRSQDRKLPEVADRDRRIEVRVIMAMNEELVGAVLTELNGRLRQVDDLVP